MQVKKGSRRLITPDDWVISPWKNGKGISKQILIFPETATLARGNYLWRVSIATTTESCRFSLFPGYARALIQIGEGSARLKAEDNSVSRVTQKYEPIYFSGDMEMDCQLASSEFTDINSMVKTDLGSLKMTFVNIGAHEARNIETNAGMSLFYIVAGEGECQVGGKFVDLLPERSLFLEGRSFTQKVKVETGDENVLLIQIDVESGTHS